MKKLIYSGKCIETGEIIKGSLIQFDDGTHTIMFKEKDGKGITRPVHPESVIAESLIIAMGKYYQNAIDEPVNFDKNAYEEDPKGEGKSTIEYLLSLV